MDRVNQVISSPQLSLSSSTLSHLPHLKFATHTLSNTRTHSICTNCMWYSLVGSILWSFCFCGSVFRSVFGYAVLGAKRLMLSEREELSHPVIRGNWACILMGRSLDQQIGLVYFPRSRGSNWKVCCLPILIDIQLLRSWYVFDTTIQPSSIRITTCSSTMISGPRGPAFRCLCETPTGSYRV